MIFFVVARHPTTQLVKTKPTRGSSTGGWELMNRQWAIAATFSREAWTSRIVLTHNLPPPPNQRLEAAFVSATLYFRH